MPAWLVSLLPGVLGRVFDFAEGWRDRRAEEARAKHEVRIMRIKDMSGSWKDEYILILSSYPLVSLFIPALRPSTIESINYLKELPGWMTATWVGIVAAVYGFQKIPNIKK